MLRYLFLVAMFLGLTPPAFADEAPSDNLEMVSIFEADQKIRRSFSPEQLKDQEYVSRMIAEDEQRRARTAELFKNGALKTGNDAFRATFILSAPAFATPSYPIGSTWKCLPRLNEQNRYTC